MQSLTSFRNRKKANNSPMKRTEMCIDERRTLLKNSTSNPDEEIGLVNPNLIMSLFYAISQNMNTPTIVPVPGSESNPQNISNTNTTKKHLDDYIPEIIKKLYKPTTLDLKIDLNNNLGEEEHPNSKCLQSILSHEDINLADLTEPADIVKKRISDIPETEIIPLNINNETYSIEQGQLRYLKVISEQYKNLEMRTQQLIKKIDIRNPKGGLASYRVQVTFFIVETSKFGFIILVMVRLEPLEHPFWFLLVTAVIHYNEYNVMKYALVIKSYEIIFEQLTTNYYNEDVEFLAPLLVLSLCSLGMAQELLTTSIKKSAKVGDVFGIKARYIHFFLQSGNLILNLAILWNNEAYSNFQREASFVFFAKTFLNFKLASTIAKDVQYEVIESHSKHMNDPAKELFNKQTGQLRDNYNDELHGNASIIRQLNKNEVSKTKDLYEMMSNPNVDSHEVKLTSEGLQGFLNVNQNLIIYPFKLLEIPDDERNGIYYFTKKLRDGLKSEKVFKSLTKLSKDYRLVFEYQNDENESKICDFFEKDTLKEIDINGHKIFSTATPHEINRTANVLKNTLNFNKNILKIVLQFDKMKTCTTILDFIVSIEFVVSVIADEKIVNLKEYEAKLNTAKFQENFNLKQFKKNYGIMENVKIKDHFFNEAVNKFFDEIGILKLNKLFQNQHKTVRESKEISPLWFSDDDTATYHYVKHKVVRGTELSPEEYLKVCCDVLENPKNFVKSMLSQDGEVVIHEYIDRENKVFVVMNFKDGRYFLATGYFNARIK